MKKIFVFLNLLIFILLTGCIKDKPEDKPKEEEKVHLSVSEEYENFKMLDYSSYPLIYDKNYYNYDDIDWFEMLEQNDVYSYIRSLYLKSKITFDSSKIKCLNYYKSELILVYNDKINPIIKKSVPFIYWDITKDKMGNPTNIIPRIYSLSYPNNFNYDLIFESYDNDYYQIGFYQHYKIGEIGPDNYPKRDVRYYEKYTTSKTYYFDNNLIVKVWKEDLGYRIDIIDAENNNKITKYKVYSIDNKLSNSRYFLSLKGIDYTYLIDRLNSKIEYDVQYIKLDKLTHELTVNFKIYDKEGTIQIDKIFNTDYHTETYTEQFFNYIIDITRISENLVNLKFTGKNGREFHSYTIEANKIVN